MQKNIQETLTISYSSIKEKSNKSSEKLYNKSVLYKTKRQGSSTFFGLALYGGHSTYIFELERVFFLCFFLSGLTSSSIFSFLFIRKTRFGFFLSQKEEEKEENVAFRM